MDPRAARELFLTGEPFDGARAREAGLLDRAVAEGALDETVDGLVRSLRLGAPEALAVTKQLLRDVPGAGVAEDFRRMAAVSAERFGSAEAQEGIAALLAKRPAAWVPQAG
jgi:methylglutaconyl-CoA hydratase